MKRTIYLHGYLKDLHPDPIEVSADTVAEAVRVLELFPELEPGPDNKHPIEIDGVSDQISLFGSNPMEEIHIRPLTGGSGGGRGFFQVVLGVALVGLAVWQPGLLPTLGGLMSTSSYAMAGAMMALGGVQQMMMAAPEIGTRGSQDESSDYIPAQGNTVKIGTSIPIIWGVHKAFGHYLSFDVDTKSVTTLSPTNGTGFIERLFDDDAAQERFGVTSTGARRPGKFTYEIYRPLNPEVAERAEEYVEDGTFDSSAEWRLFASGRKDTVDPVRIWRTVTEDNRERGFIARYRGFVEVDRTRHVAFNPFGAQSSQVTVWSQDEILSPRSDGRYRFVAGESYTVEVILADTYSAVNDGGYSSSPSRANGSIGFSLRGGDYFVLNGVPDPRPVEVKNLQFHEHDKFEMSDDVALGRPVFADPELGPDNVPSPAGILV